MNNIVAYCPPDTITAGGGYFGVDGETRIMDSRPDHINSAWYVVAYRTNDVFSQVMLLAQSLPAWLSNSFPPVLTTRRSLTVVFIRTITVGVTSE